MLHFVRFRKGCLGDFMAVSADCHRGVTGHLHRRATGAIIVVPAGGARR